MSKATSMSKSSKPVHAPVNRERRPRARSGSRSRSRSRSPPNGKQTKNHDQKRRGSRSRSRSGSRSRSRSQSGSRSGSRSPSRDKHSPCRSPLPGNQSVRKTNPKHNNPKDQTPKPKSQSLQDALAKAKAAAAESAAKKATADAAKKALNVKKPELIAALATAKKSTDTSKKATDTTKKTVNTSKVASSVNAKKESRVSSVVDDKNPDKQQSSSKKNDPQPKGTKKVNQWDGIEWAKLDDATLAQQKERLNTMVKWLEEASAINISLGHKIFLRSPEFTSAVMDHLSTKKVISYFADVQLSQSERDQLRAIADDK